MNKTPFILSATILFAASASAAIPQRFAHRAPDLETRNTVAMRSTRFEKLHRSANEVSAKIYKPTLEQFFTYNGGRWSLENSTSFTYDDQGRITQAESEDGGTIYRTTYTYDAWGNQTCALDETSADGGNTWVIYEKKENTYDEVVHSFQLDNLRYSAIDGKLELTYGHRRNVERNSAGSVTKVELSLFSRGMTDPDGNPAFEPMKYSTCSYADNAPDVPVAWSFNELTYNDITQELKWLESTRFSNIVWNRTDGQMLSFDEIDYKTGANRIASCEILDEEQYPSVMTVEYPGGIDYHSLIVSHASNFEGTIDETLTALDSYGSIRQVRVTTGNENGSTYVMEMTTEKLYDSHKNLIKEEGSFSTDGILEDYVCAEYENSYDDRGALLSTIGSEYDVDMDKMLPMHKLEYSDFIEFEAAGTTATGITADKTMKLQGRSLEISAGSKWQLDIHDLSGAALMKTSGSEQAYVDLSALSAGIYTATLRTPDGTSTVKLAIR